MLIGAITLKLHGHQLASYGSISVLLHCYKSTKPPVPWLELLQALCQCEGGDWTVISTLIMCLASVDGDFARLKRTWMVSLVPMAQSHRHHPPSVGIFAVLWSGLQWWHQDIQILTESPAADRQPAETWVSVLMPGVHVTHPPPDPCFLPWLTTCPAIPGSMCSCLLAGPAGGRGVCFY